LTVVLLPTAVDRVFETALAPELLDDAPLPIGLPITLTFGLEIACDCDPDVVVTAALLFDPDCEVCAKAPPLSIANAVAARSMFLIEVYPWKCPGRTSSAP
jgi:hypothetical protein